MFSFRRSALTWNDVRVGLFIVIGIGIILLSVFMLQPGKHLGSAFKVRSIFSTVGGLSQGAPVTMSGVQVGTVVGIRIIQNPGEVPSNQLILKELKVLREAKDHVNATTPKGRQIYRKLQSKYARLQSDLKRVSVLMEVSSAQRDLVGGASIASIKNQGIVGEKYVDISTSDPDTAKLSPVSDVTGVAAVEIPGQEPVDMNAVLRNAAGATGSLEELMDEVNEDITQGKGTLGKLIKDPSVHDNLNKTLKETARATKYTGDLMESIKKGKGTMGKLFTDASLFNSANNMLKSIDTGEGTIGKLIHDPSIYENANGSMKEMNALLTQANHGHGTFEKLLHDSALYQNTNHLMRTTSSFVESTNQGKGTFGKLATDDALYSNTNKAMAGMAEVTDKINKGQGTLGMLLQDKKIYTNLTTLSDEMVEFMKEFRKNPRKYLNVQVSVIKFF